MAVLSIDHDNKLGFGCMRLPILDGDNGKIDIPLFAKMADAFMQGGYTYFDTSFVYHNGQSEAAVRQAVVEKHPRDSFTVATKYPAFLQKPEEEIEGIFTQQLKNLGVDCVDFYLLHNLQTSITAGSEASVNATHLFDHAKAWKKEGKIRYLGFSFHDTNEVLEKLLAEHPEVDFVQIVVNYYDWDSEWIQSRENLEVLRKHGKAIIAMEPVKGGYLASVPDACLELMHACDPDLTPSAWAIRFAASQEGVYKVLSGMSTMEQVKDNVQALHHFKPLSDKEREMLFECAKIMRAQGPVGQVNVEQYAGLTYHGIPVSTILREYNTIASQPDVGFAADNNYVRQQLLKNGVTDIHTNWPEEKVVFGGKDITAQVKKAWNYIVDHAF